MYLRKLFRNCSQPHSLSVSALYIIKYSFPVWSISAGLAVDRMSQLSKLQPTANKCQLWWYDMLLTSVNSTLNRTNWCHLFQFSADVAISTAPPYCIRIEHSHRAQWKYSFKDFTCGCHFHVAANALCTIFGLAMCEIPSETKTKQRCCVEFSF